MAAPIPGLDNEALLKQAQSIWTMLDEMATNSPAAYKSFIDKQISEGKAALAPPAPHMAVKTTLLKPSKGSLFINFCSWQKVPGPKTSDDPVPVIGVSIDKIEDKSGSYQMTSVAFNPDVLDKYGRKAESLADRDTLINLAIDYIEDQHSVKVSRSYNILAEDMPHKGCIKHIQSSFSKKSSDDKQFENGLDHLEKNFGPLGQGSKDGLLQQLANISVTDSQSESRKSESSQSEIKMPFDNVKPKTNLIQEIQNVKKPEYSLDTVTDESGTKSIQVKIILPGVSSVGQCELEISQDDISLQVTDKYDLHVTLPQRVDEDESTAKFNKKQSSLTVTMPCV